MLENGTVLVTGGAGFIGSHIAERLLEMGRPVRILDNYSTGNRATTENLRATHPELCSVLEGDIRVEADVRAALDGVTQVIHQAALPSVPRSVEDPLASNEVNITGTLRLLLAARDAGVKRFLYAGSSSVYGDQPELPKRESMTPQPRSPYALGKLTGETYCTMFYHLYGLPTVVLRYFNVFGPRQNPDSQYAAVVPLFIRALLRGEPPHIYGDGGQTRDFTYISNVVDANLLALEAEADRVGGRVLNIACGGRASLLELLEEIASAVGRRVEPILEPPRAGDVRDSQAAIEEAERLLGFRPRTGLPEGLIRTTEWYRASLGW
jgi:nucleoside-diphosphate-sugar epimerase